MSASLRRATRTALARAFVTGDATATAAMGSSSATTWRREYAAASVPKDFKVPPPALTQGASGPGGRSSFRYAWVLLIKRARVRRVR